MTDESLTTRIRELISEARYELDSPQTIADLGLSVRTYNVLHRSRLVKISDLQTQSEQDLLKIEYMGPVCVADIKRELAVYGLQLKAGV